MYRLNYLHKYRFVYISKHIGVESNSWRVIFACDLSHFNRVYSNTDERCRTIFCSISDSYSVTSTRVLSICLTKTNGLHVIFKCSRQFSFKWDENWFLLIGFLKLYWKLLKMDDKYEGNCWILLLTKLLQHCVALKLLYTIEHVYSCQCVYKNKSR